jgi:hypothetical protein
MYPLKILGKQIFYIIGHQLGTATFYPFKQFRVHEGPHLLLQSQQLKLKQKKNPKKSHTIFDTITMGVLHIL